MDSTKYWIALERVPGIGPAHMKEIYSVVNAAGISFSEIFDLTAEEIRNEFKLSDNVISAVRSAAENISVVNDEYQKIIDSGITVITFFSKNYPERLNQLLGNSIPPVLYTYGNYNLLNTRGAAILGDNIISSRGEFITYMAAKELAARRITVISGYANGADMTAHRSALEYGGDTIAFVPYGIFRLEIPDIIKPVIDMERFLAVSIFNPEEQAGKYKVILRNKCICALSRAVFIVEAPENGGIFDAAKSAQNLKIPLYTAEYSDYPESASGNRKIISELGGLAVRGRKNADNLTIPNIDRIIADVKFK